MGKALKRQLKIMKNNMVWQLGFTPAGCLFGVLLMFIIMGTDKTVTTYFTLGTLMGAIFCGMYALVMSISVQLYFNIEVSMGCTRKEFFWSYFAVNLLSDLLCVGILILFCLVEKRFYALIFPALENEIDMMPYLLKFGAPTAAVIAVIGMFAGVTMMKYGQKAFWVFWALWMFGALGVPRIHTAMEEAPKSFFGMIGNQALRVIRFVPGNIWIAAMTVICLGIFGASILFIRKQQV